MSFLIQILLLSYLKILNVQLKNIYPWPKSKVSSWSFEGASGFVDSH